MWGISVLHLRHPRKTCHFIGCCLHIFPDFEQELFPNFDFEPGQKVQQSCWLNSQWILFWSYTAAHSCMHSTAIGGLLLSGKISNWFNIHQDDFSLCCIPQNVCVVEKCHLCTQKVFRVCWHFKLSRPKERTKDHWSVRFLFWLQFRLWFIFYHEGLNRTPEAFICHHDKLQSLERLS